jgi:hypothetical protein
MLPEHIGQTRSTDLCLYHFGSESDTRQQEGEFTGSTGKAFLFTHDVLLHRNNGRLARHFFCLTRTSPKENKNRLYNLLADQTL